eukprot:2277212-Prymnesium_polylepis.1
MPAAVRHSMVRAATCGSWQTTPRSVLRAATCTAACAPALRAQWPRAPRCGRVQIRPRQGHRGAAEHHVPPVCCAASHSAPHRTSGAGRRRPSSGRPQSRSHARAAASAAVALVPKWARGHRRSNA